MPKNQQLKDLFSFLKPINPKLEKYNDYNEFRQRFCIESGSEAVAKRFKEWLNTLSQDEQIEFKIIFDT